MRVHFHLNKKASIVNIQLNSKLLLNVLNELKLKVLRIGGKKAEARGRGWYRFSGHPGAELRDLKYVVRSIRIAVFAIAEKTVQAMRPDPESVIRLGLIKTINLQAPKRFVLVKQIGVDHNRPVYFAIDRARQACEGLLSEILSVFQPKPAVAQDRLFALQHRFNN